MTNFRGKKRIQRNFYFYVKCTMRVGCWVLLVWPLWGPKQMELSDARLYATKNREELKPGRGLSDQKKSSLHSPVLQFARKKIWFFWVFFESQRSCVCKKNNLKKFGNKKTNFLRDGLLLRDELSERTNIDLRTAKLTSAKNILSEGGIKDIGGWTSPPHLYYAGHIESKNTCLNRNIVN